MGVHVIYAMPGMFKTGARRKRRPAAQTASAAGIALAPCERGGQASARGVMSTWPEQPRPARRD